MKFSLASILIVLALTTPSNSFSAAEEAAENNDIGLALAGGSFRAASSCMGILRGLQQKRISDGAGETIPAMEKVKYNSGISGGSLPAILFSYAQVPVDELLDTNRAIDPSKITREDLDDMPKSSMGFCLSKQPNQRWKMLIEGLKFLILTKLNFLRLHSFWNTGVFKKVLKKYNVPRNKYIGPKEEELDAILEENKHLKKDQFLMPRADVKTTPLILFSMHGQTNDKNEYMKNFDAIMTEAWDQYHKERLLGVTYPGLANNSLEKRSLMTDVVLGVRDRTGDGNIPIPFVGSHEVIETRYRGSIKLKEATVEFPLKTEAPYEWGCKGSALAKRVFGENRLSVEFLAGMSTNFPGTVLSDIGNVRKINLDGDSLELPIRFADGGSNDLTGILPLVQRNVKNIILIYNFNQNPPYADQATTYSDIYKGANGCTDLNDPNFNYYFSKWLKFMNPRLTCLFGYYGIKKIKEANILNHVFWDPNQDVLKGLMVKLNTLYENGQPLIVELKDLEVIDNPFWGVKAKETQKINLTLIYFNMPKKFSEQVPDSVSGGIDEDGHFTNPEFRTVPELPNDGLDPLRYSKAEINIMGHLGSWMVDQAWDGLKSKDGKVIFDGFGKIFE